MTKTKKFYRFRLKVEVYHEIKAKNPGEKERERATRDKGVARDTIKGILILCYLSLKIKLSNIKQNSIENSFT